MAHGLEVSGWMAGFMLEAVYEAAGTISEGVLPVGAVARAVDFAYRVLTATGVNSWLGMIGQNATMTSESWRVPAEGGGTFSALTSREPVLRARRGGGLAAG